MINLGFYYGFSEKHFENILQQAFAEASLWTRSWAGPCRHGHGGDDCRWTPKEHTAKETCGGRGEGRAWQELRSCTTHSEQLRGPLTPEAESLSLILWIWCRVSLRWRDCPVHYGMFTSISEFYPLNAHSTLLPQLWQPKLPPELPNVPWRWEASEASSWKSLP